MTKRTFGKSSTRLETLERVPLFSSCSPDELSVLAGLFEEAEIPAGHVLTREGWIGNEFFVVLHGIATVMREGERVASLGPGSFFGEAALLGRVPLPATVTAVTAMRVLFLASRRLESLLQEMPVIGHRLIDEITGQLQGHEARRRTPLIDGRTRHLGGTSW